MNALAPVALGTLSGTGFSLTGANLADNWNLVATGDDVTPASFGDTIGNVTTLWAWDNASSKWYFQAPSLLTGNMLTSYIQSKEYQEFGVITLGNGRGFWVNYAGPTTTGISVSLCSNTSSLSNFSHVSSAPPKLPDIGR